MTSTARTRTARTRTARTSTAARRAATGALAALVVAGTSGCAVADMLSAEKTQHYDSVADAPGEGDGDLAFQLPEVVPDDATDITVRVMTEDPDLKAYDWAGGGPLPEECVPGGPPAEVDPFYTSGGWPEEATEVAGRVCSNYLQVTEVDGHHYAWILPA